MSSSEHNHQPACWGVDPEVFYGAGDSPAGGRVVAWEREALAVCVQCPVTAGCLVAALEFPAEEQYGVIGSMTAGQRRALLATQRRRPSRSSMSDTPVDRRGLVQAAVRLYQAGQNAPRIAASLGLGTRRVQRWLAAHREGAA